MQSLPDNATLNFAEKSESILIPKIQPQDKGKIKSNFFSQKNKLRIFLSILLGLVILFVVVVTLILYQVFVKAKQVQDSVTSLNTAFKSQNLTQVKEQMEITKQSFKNFKSAYARISWMQVLPLAGQYVADGSHVIVAGEHSLEAANIMVSAVEPYADIIGFTKGADNNKNQGGETAKDRLDFIVKTIPDLIPKTDGLIAEVKIIRQEIDGIDPARYPEKIRGKEIRSKLIKGKEYVNMTAEIVEKGRPLLESAPYLLGVDKERSYLILFQNDKELRPTGGFLTAYSMAKVEKGKFEPVASDDIYNIDGKYTPVIPAPEPLITHIKGPYILSKKLRLRDINWSPDAPEAFELFSKEAEKVGLKNYDGIIAVDTQMLVDLLNVLGPIDVDGYGKYSTEIEPKCNCPQVIYELESFADVEGPVVWNQDTGEIMVAPPNMDNRKKIIGPLMNAVLKFTLAQPKEKMPALFEAAYKSLLEKHVIFYLFDDTHQKAVEEFGIAGKVEDYSGDYLMINDANLGGRKSNLYVTQEVQQTVNINKNGEVEKTVTITYKNPEKYDGWLNSVLPNWVRIYVPKGSELISFEGLEEKQTPYEEFGKTVFAGFFELRPQGVSRVVLKYKLPAKFVKEYNIFIQKQPGKDAPLYSIEVGKSEDEFKLLVDKELKYKI